METSGHLQKAQQAYEKGNYAYAIEVLENLLSVSPSSAEARHLLHLAKQQRVTHISPVQKALSSLAAGSSLITAKIIAFKNKEDHWKVIDAYEKVLSRDPYNSAALMAISSLLIAENQPGAAIAALQEILKASPNHAMVLKQLAGLYLQLNRQKEARDCFEKILKIDPKNAEAERSLKNLDAMDAIRGMKEEGANPAN